MEDLRNTGSAMTCTPHQILWQYSNKFLNVVLEKDGKDQLDRSCEKWEVLRRVNEERNILHTVKRRKAIWIGHIYARTRLLKHILEVRIGGRIKVTERQGKSRKQLLDDRKETRWYWKLKEEALDRNLRRTRFGRGYGSVVRQTMEWMNEWWASQREWDGRNMCNACTRRRMQRLQSFGRKIWKRGHVKALRA
jgi:ribosomal protein L37AE/L43A